MGLVEAIDYAGSKLLVGTSVAFFLVLLLIGLVFLWEAYSWRKFKQNLWHSFEKRIRSKPKE